MNYIEARVKLYSRDKLGLSYSMLKLKADEFANQVLTVDDRKSFKISNGWICNVLERNGMKSVKLWGEASEVDLSKAAETMNHFRVEVQRICEEHGISLDRIYNADQTGLFCRMYCFRIV